MILIVEDEPDLRQMIADILEKENHKTIQASNCPEAVAIVKVKKVKGAILDIGMPGANCIELAKELQKIRPNITLLCLSGYAQMLEVDVLAAGIKNIMEKPFFEEGLLSMARKIFPKR